MLHDTAPPSSTGSGLGKHTPSTFTTRECEKNAAVPVPSNLPVPTTRSSSSSSFPPPSVPTIGLFGPHAPTPTTAPPAAIKSHAAARLIITVLIVLGGWAQPRRLIT